MVLGSGDVFLSATRYQPEAGHPETDHKTDSEADPLEHSRRIAGVPDADQDVLKQTESCSAAEVDEGSRSSIVGSLKVRRIY